MPTALMVAAFSLNTTCALFWPSAICCKVVMGSEAQGCGVAAACCRRALVDGDAGGGRDISGPRVGRHADGREQRASAVVQFEVVGFARFAQRAEHPERTRKARRKAR